MYRRRTRQRLHGHSRWVALFALVSLTTVYCLLAILVYAQFETQPQYDTEWTMMQQQQQQRTLFSLASLKMPNELQSPPSWHVLRHHAFPLHTNVQTMESIAHPAVPYINPEQVHNTVKKRYMNDTINVLLTQNLTVPMFYDTAYANAHGGMSRIRHTLERAGQEEPMMTREQAASIGSYYIAADNNGRVRLETIFVGIASYRDPECLPTVVDLYQRAAHPERIRVAIVDQQRLRNEDGDSIHDNDDDDDDLESHDGAPEPTCQPPTVADCINNNNNKDPTTNHPLCPFAHLIEYYSLNARLAVGPVFARHLVQRHYRGGAYEQVE